MPQMAPLNWLSLYFMFIFIFLIFNSLNYYCFYYNPSIKKFKMKKINKNWMW